MKTDQFIRICIAIATVMIGITAYSLLIAAQTLAI